MKMMRFFPVFLLSWLVWMFIEAKKNIVKTETLRVPDLPESFCGRSIFFISDIHYRRIPESLLENINETPDFVIIGGDLTEKGVPFDNILHNIRQLKKVGQLVFVWGNNDVEEKPDMLRELLQKEDVILLENECLTWTVDDETIGIAGVGNKKQLVNDNFLEEGNEDDITLLVAHDPAALHYLSHLKTVRAILSGHTHGGQIRLGPFGLREKGGWKIRRGLPLLISNGYGTTKFPLRWGAPSETHLITLKRI